MTDRLTFGVVDQVQIAGAHIVSMRSGAPLATMPESTHTAWASGAAAGSYPVGTIVWRALTHRKYTRVVAHAAVETTPPEQAPDKWADAGPTNGWAPYDIYTYTELSAPAAFELTLRPQATVDTVYLGGITCASVRVTVTDGPGGPVIGEVEDTLSGTGRYDWQSFFLAPVVVHDSLLLMLDYPSADPVILIELDGAGDNVTLGNLVVGRRFMFGSTEYDTDIGPVSYTGWEEAADGTVKITRRPGAGDLNVASVVVPREYASAVRAILKKYDARPALWIAYPSEDPWLRPLREYGVFNGRLKWPHYGNCTLSGRIKGMV